MKPARSIYRFDRTPPTMQQISRTFTTMLFAAHALLGCCAHHACGAGVAANDLGDCSVACHSDDHCPAEHGTSHDPAEEGQAPCGPCDHESCSFVKVQPVRVDDGSGQVGWIAAVVPAASHVNTASQTLIDAGFPFASYAAPLYVRFCALLL